VGTGDATSSLFGFQSDPTDPDTGLVDMGTRNYDPSQGRFTARDSLFGDPAHPMSLNQFAYGVDNPVSTWDPDGMAPQIRDAGVGVTSTARTLKEDIANTQAEADQIWANYYRWARIAAINAAPPKPPVAPKPEHHGWFHALTHSFAAAGHFVAHHPLQVVAAVATVAAVALTAGALAPLALEVGSALAVGDFAGAGVAIAEATLVDAGAAVADAGAAELDAKAAEGTTVELPEALTVGKNSESGVDVYTGVKGGKDTYVGITNDLERRAAQHGERFALSPVTSESMTRGEARAIEQAMMERNPGFENIRNSISPAHPWYQQAVDWGEQWLQSNGF
jgi:RHS repeat-associated protein